MQSAVAQPPLEGLGAVIKSAASAASTKTNIQESRGAGGRRLGMLTAGTARLPWIPKFWSWGRVRSSRLDHQHR